MQREVVSTLISGREQDGDARGAAEHQPASLQTRPRARRAAHPGTLPVTAVGFVPLNRRGFSPSCLNNA